MRDCHPADEREVSVAVSFLPSRNTIMATGDFGSVFVDCYLHLAAAGMVLRDGTDGILKSSLAMLALYASTRPPEDTLAWTLHFEEEALNFFVTAENRPGLLVGRAFARNVREVGCDVLHAEVASATGARRRSSVSFEGGVVGAVEQFYARSEQRPGRFFVLDGDTFAALLGQPDCDESWLSAVSADEVVALPSDSGTHLLEVRSYRFGCGCSPERIASAIGVAIHGSLDEVFGSDTRINVDCPRCGLRHELARNLFGPVL